jgi:hypothetical protein
VWIYWIKKAKNGGHICDRGNAKWNTKTGNAGEFVTRGKRFLKVWNKEKNI